MWTWRLARYPNAVSGPSIVSMKYAFQSLPGFTSHSLLFDVEKNTSAFDCGEIVESPAWQASTFTDVRQETVVRKPYDT